jgi:hypothetical protein
MKTKSPIERIVPPWVIVIVRVVGIVIGGWIVIIFRPKVDLVA